LKQTQSIIVLLSTFTVDVPKQTEIKYVRIKWRINFISDLFEIL